MRLFSAAALLTLPAVLVAAIPAYIEQHPFSAPTASARSQWRTLSGRLIDSIWRPRDGDLSYTARPIKSDVQAPPHTLARYGGDMVLRFNISTPEEAKSLAEAADTLLLDVWEFSHDWVDIRLSKDIVGPLLGLLPKSLEKSHTPLLRERELAEAIFDTYPGPRSLPGRTAEPAYNPPVLRNATFSPALKQRNGETNIFFNDYQPLSVIDPWLRLMSSLFTTHVRKVSIGVSYEGREIPGIRVGVHPTNNDEPNLPRRKTVLITGGLHAREWISTSTVNFIAYSFITGYGKSREITRLLEDFDFMFVPTVNPDGYVYTWQTDRLWRKNRQNTNFRFCHGMDLDRSFGYHWDGAASAAGNPCSESFAGDAPFEALEARLLADWAKNETENNNVDFVGLLDLHSYSQQILYPYSYSCDHTPPQLENLQELAAGLAKSIRTSHGHNYEIMAACEGNSVVNGKKSKQRLSPRMEAAGGSALDWFYHELKVHYAYQIKLRDRGMYGFLLPREYIVPTGKEILDAVLHFGEYLSGTYSAGGATVDDASPAEEGELGDSNAATTQEHGFDAIGKDDATSDWVWIDDVDAEDVQWELKRRR